MNDVCADISRLLVYFITKLILPSGQQLFFSCSFAAIPTDKTSTDVGVEENTKQGTDNQEMIPSDFQPGDQLKIGESSKNLCDNSADVDSFQNNLINNDLIRNHPCQIRKNCIYKCQVCLR